MSLYDTYFYAERVMNLSPLEDQKTGGVLMKLANMIVSVSVLSSIFYTDGLKNKRIKPFIKATDVIPTIPAQKAFL